MKVISGTLAVIAGATSINALSTTAGTGLTAPRAATGDLLGLIDTIRRRAEFDGAVRFYVDLKTLRIYAVEKNGHANTTAYLSAMDAALTANKTETYFAAAVNTDGLFDPSDYWTTDAHEADEHQLVTLLRSEIIEDAIPFPKTLNFRKGTTLYTSTGWTSRKKFTFQSLITAIWAYYEDTLDPAGTAAWGANSDVPYFVADDKLGNLEINFCTNANSAARSAALAAIVPGGGANVLALSVTPPTLAGAVTVSDPTRRFQG